MEILKNYINGSWTESREQQTTNVVNPANQEILAKVPYGENTVADVNWQLPRQPKR
jgi:malonate-semialdehyde dehydrogenase (acetylating) / methylmalonate-semialdehyde dehydrogenase